MPHLLNGEAVDHVSVVIIQRTVKSDAVALIEQLLQRVHSRNTCQQNELDTVCTDAIKVK